MDILREEMENDNPRIQRIVLERRDERLGDRFCNLEGRDLRYLYGF